MRNLVVGFLVVLSLFLAGVLALLFLWWLLSRGRKKAPAPLEITLTVPDEAEEVEAPPSSAERGGDDARLGGVDEPGEPAEPDDLTQIEGIGPRIAGVLQAAGICTYLQLAEAEVSRIEELLEAESPRLRGLADPTTWPEQAALAAAGEWEALEALQGTLQRGRRRG